MGRYSWALIMSHGPTITQVEKTYQASPIVGVRRVSLCRGRNKHRTDIQWDLTISNDKVFEKPLLIVILVAYSTPLLLNAVF